MVDGILHKLGINSLNTMQEAAVEAAAAGDLILLAPTGSGKTLAFLIPLVKRLVPGKPGVQALVIVPSRELALQIRDVFRGMGTGFRVNVLYGGHSVKTELNELRTPPAVLIGTPGRLAYHLREESFEPSSVDTLVLDEFDKSLEFGFEEDMAYISGRLSGLDRRILTSATAIEAVPGFTGAGGARVLDFLNDKDILPVHKLVGVEALAPDKFEALISLLHHVKGQPTLVFCNHRDAAERVVSELYSRGSEVGIFHGGMPQEEREKMLLKFRNGSFQVLITTDLASRGLDIPEIGSVIHYQLPVSEPAFIHRNGRTARMKSTGTVYVILTTDEHPAYLPGGLDMETIPERLTALPAPEWVTFYVGAGRKDKVNKVDVAGLFLKKGGLQKDELGLIEVHDSSSFAAVRRDKSAALLRAISGEKIKNKRVKIEISE